MVISLYVGIILSATISGAMAGLGGGVIIKPLLDMVGYHDASTIGFYSSVAVFTMCIVSIYKQIKSGFTFNMKTIVFISLGSILGGILGENLFNYTVASLSGELVTVIQAGFLGVTLLFIILYTLNRSKMKSFKINNGIVIFLAGSILGIISIFLGIGGGPLNVAMMMFLFSYNMKEAAVYSIATIFFSQLSKLAMLTINNRIVTFDLSFIPFICIAAVLGGIIGTYINQKLSNKNIEKFYNGLMTILLVISCYNVISNI